MSGAGFVPRERLFRMLDRVRRRRVAWLEAPAGAGKTTLLETWIRSRRLDALWISLGPGDDVASVFTRLREAAMRRQGHRARAIPAFQAEHLRSIDPYARAVIGGLGAGPGAPDLIVLDDYHAVSADSALHRALAQACSTVERAAPLVVASRRGPPRAFARLRADGGMIELPSRSLALAPREARAVARLRGAPRLPSAMLALADGWAAGVVLLAAAQVARAGRGAAPREAVFDYIASEIFEGLDADVRRVLLGVALLPAVDVRTAVRMSGVPAAGEVLARLAASGWFVEALGAEAYRLHALLREFLVAKIREEGGPAGFLPRVEEAAGHLVAAGDVDAAAGLLVEAERWEALAQVLVREAPALAAAGRLEALSGWLARLPPSLYVAEPWLRHWRGVARFVADPEAGIADVEEALAGFRQRGDATGSLRAWATAVDLRIVALDDLAPLGRRLGELAALRAHLPGADTATEAAVVGSALAAHGNVRAGDPPTKEWEDRAMEIALAPGDARVRLDVGRQLLLRCAYWGTDVVRAGVVLEALGHLGNAEGADPVHAMVWHLGVSNFHTHRGDGALAMEVADRGLELAARSGIHALDALLLSARIYGALAEEAFAPALRDLRALARVTKGGRLASCSYQYTAAVLALRRGELMHAVEGARIAARLAAEAGHPMARAASQIVWAVAADRGGGPGPSIDDALAAARASGYRVGAAGALLAGAAGALRRGDEGGAVTRLRRALAIARRIGVLNSVFVSREETADLCALALEHGIDPPLATRIVVDRRLAPTLRARRVPAWPWPIRVELLGGFDVRRDGRELPGGKAQRKPLELLRRLALAGERGAPLHRLAESLWPDADGDAGLHALETAIYRLRRLLGDPDAVVRRRGRLAIDPARVFVDAWAFEALAALAAEEGARGAGRAAARAAAALYRGDLLDDDDDPELDAPRARLRAERERLGPLP